MCLSIRGSISGSTELSKEKPARCECACGVGRDCVGTEQGVKVKTG